MSDTARAIERAVDNGADVINRSAGGECGSLCRAFGGANGAARAALRHARDNGVPVIAAAGNEDIDLDDAFAVPCETLGGSMTVCVGAVDREGDRAGFSNFGGKVDIFAPGVWVRVGSNPEIQVPHYVNGTSFSSPFVAGIVAMATAMKGQAPSVAEIEQGLRWGAIASSDPDDDNDCVKDANDNCPTVVNAHQFCDAADSSDVESPTGFSGCGDRGCWDPIDKDELAGFDRAIYDCFTGVPADPGCFIDGCPFPGPMVYPEVAAVVDVALSLHRGYRHRGKDLGGGLDEEMHTLAEFRFLEDGRVILPASLQPPENPGYGPEGPVPKSQLPIGAVQAVPHCGKVLDIGGRLAERARRDRTAGCWNGIRSRPCLADADGDGVGDACETP